MISAIVVAMRKLGVIIISIMPMFACSNSAAQAVSGLQDESSVAPIPPNPSSLQLDAARRVEVEEAIKRHDYRRAETILVEESNRDPNSVRSARLLEMAGGLFFADREFLDAAIALKRAESIAPLDERTSFILAMAYVKLERRDWARSQLERLANAQPTNSLYGYWLARLDYDAQNYTAAVNRLRKVVELDPKMARAYDVLGLCYDYLGQQAAAIQALTRASELNRQQAKPSPWPNMDLAKSLISANQLTEAEKNLREARSYDPQLPQVYYELGRVLDMQGKSQDAIQALKSAVDRDANYPEPHYLLGRIYQKLGQSTLAKSEIVRFQDLQRPKK